MAQLKETPMALGLVRDHGIWRVTDSSTLLQVRSNIQVLLRIIHINVTNSLQRSAIVHHFGPVILRSPSHNVY